MSFRNVRKCATCIKVRQVEIDKREAVLKESYGKVDVSVYMQRNAELEAFKAQPVKETWREYYDISSDGSYFGYSYRGDCEVCGHSFEESSIKEVVLAPLPRLSPESR